jgi:peptidylprolyl isomerase
VAGCGGGDSSSSSGSTSEGTSKEAAADAGKFGTKPKVTVPGGPPPKKLESVELIEGDGATAKAGDQVTVQYVGVGYESGEQFDASWDRNEPFSFGLGNGEVIAGWDQGVAGMKVGGRRRITIPPHLAYGKRGAGGAAIPPDAELTFDVELLKVK